MITRDNTSAGQARSDIVERAEREAARLLAKAKLEADRLRCTAARQAKREEVRLAQIARRLARRPELPLPHAEAIGFASPPAVTRALSAQQKRVVLRLSSRLNSAIEAQTTRDHKRALVAAAAHLGPCPGDPNDWPIDHIVPLCAFDLRDPEQVRLATGPANVRWLPAAENRAKSDADRLLVGVWRKPWARGLSRDWPPALRWQYARKAPPFPHARHPTQELGAALESAGRPGDRPSS